MMKKMGLPIEQFPAAKQRRLDQLLDKNSEGTITAAEKAKLEVLVAEAEQLMVVNAQRMAEFARQNGNCGPKGGTPVTVWVQPAPSGN